VERLAVRGNGGGAHLIRTFNDELDRLETSAAEGQLMSIGPKSLNVLGPSQCVEERLSIMTLSTLRDRVEAPFPPCPSWIIKPLWDHFAALLPVRETFVCTQDLGPLPDEIIVHLDACYDSGKTRHTLTERGLSGQIGGDQADRGGVVEAGERMGETDGRGEDRHHSGSPNRSPGRVVR
jgi:hypothetical protein